MSGSSGAEHTIDADAYEGESIDGNNRLSQWKYCDGTLNNYSNEELELLKKKLLGPEIQGFVFQEEIGAGDEENPGIPHLQIHVWFHKKHRPIQFFNMPRISWRKVRNVDAHQRYCQKKRTRVRGPYIGGQCRRLREIEVLDEKDFYPWQQQINSELIVEADDRKIVWLWENEGNVGKSQFAKWLVVKRSAIILSGKTADVFHGIKEYLNANNGQGPDIVILDIPRSMLEYVNYQALEKVKDGCFFSGKYEGGMCVFNSPHIIVMSNARPDESNMSLDRWDIRKIVSKTFAV